MSQDAIDHVTANRRRFLKGAGMTGIGLAGAAIIGSRFVTTEQKVEAATAVSDLDIVTGGAVELKSAHIPLPQVIAIQRSFIRLWSK